MALGCNFYLCVTRRLFCCPFAIISGSVMDVCFLLQRFIATLEQNVFLAVIFGHRPAAGFLAGHCATDVPVI
jgi:hypothetical protein